MDHLCKRDVEIDNAEPTQGSSEKRAVPRVMHPGRQSRDGIVTPKLHPGKNQKEETDFKADHHEQHYA